MSDTDALKTLAAQAIVDLGPALRILTRAVKLGLVPTSGVLAEAHRSVERCLERLDTVINERVPE